METDIKTATFVKQVDGTGDGRIYRLDPPMDAGGVETEFVWVSAVVAYSGPETYIFACNEAGGVTNWTELQGSFRGGLDHAEALRGAGYEVSA